MQTVLTRKQTIADYLLNGIAINALHITNDNLKDEDGTISSLKLLYSLLRAAILHFIVLDHTLYIGEQPSGVLEVGDVWIRTLTLTGEPIIYKYTQIEKLDKDIDLKSCRFIEEIENIISRDSI